MFLYPWLLSERAFLCSPLICLHSLLRFRCQSPQACPFICSCHPRERCCALLRFSSFPPSISGPITSSMLLHLRLSPERAFLCSPPIFLLLSSSCCAHQLDAVPPSLIVIQENMSRFASNLPPSLFHSQCQSTQHCCFISHVHRRDLPRSLLLSFPFGSTQLDTIPSCLIPFARAFQVLLNHLSFCRSFTLVIGSTIFLLFLSSFWRAVSSPP